MSKYNKQFKLQVVQEYLKSGGLRRVSNLFEIATSDIRKWALAYQARGHSGLNPGYQLHPPQLKLEVLQYMAKHQLSARPTAAHFGIRSMSTILRWQKLYNEGGITALANRPRGQLSMSQFNIKALLKKPVSELTPAELRRRLEYAEAEAAYLKKLEALAQSKAAKENKPK
jgi:transposase